jgi:hypothetical protein
MDYASYTASLRQRTAQLFTRFLGWFQTSDQALQRDRQQSDGFVRSQDDPDTRQRFVAQQRQQIEQAQRQQHGRAPGGRG